MREDPLDAQRRELNVRRLAAGSVIALALLAVVAPGAAALPGDLDTSFGAPTGVVFPPNGNEVADLLLQPEDGKLIVGLGGATAPAGDGAFGVARYNADGTLDTTGWASGAADPGVAIVDIFDGFQEGTAAIARQADGKVVAAGASETRLALVRLTAEGSLDTSFNDSDPLTPQGTVVTDLPTGFENLHDVAIQPADQKIVVSGYAQQSPGDPTQVVLARYNPSGALDTGGFNDSNPSTIPGTASIDFPGVTDEAAGALLLDAAGRIVFTGRGAVGGVIRWVVARVTAAGSTDSTFGDGGSGVKVFNLGSPALPDLAIDLAAGPGGTLLVAGAVDVSGSSTASAGLARLTAAGALDPGFGNGGIAVASLGTFGYAAWVAAQPDGRLVAGGLGGASFAVSDGAIARFSATGAPDPTFGSGGRAFHAFSPALESLGSGALRPDGRIVVGGTAQFGSETVPLLARFMGGDPAPAQGPAGPGQPANTPPSLRSASMLRKRFRVGRARTPLSAQRRRAPAGTAFRFTLSERARVTIAIARRAPGRRAGRRCRRPTRRLRARPRCTRHVRVGTLSRSLDAGRHSVRFSGRLGRRPLRPAGYRATLQATDPGGLRSPPRQLRFRVVR